jgi:hypothetical protein
MSCLVCNEPRETKGVACAECLEELKLTIALTPEQIVMRGSHPTAAALVDPWGRLHRLHRRTLIGRELDDDGLRILDATISRKHAMLEQRGATWTLKDMGSSNGTYVEDCSFGTVMPIRDGERIRFGSIAFFFLDDVGSTPQLPEPTVDGFTVRGPIEMTTKPIPRLEIKAITVELREPTGGGGGVAVIDGKSVQLTVPQFEFMSILYQRARSGSEEQGFVHPAELIRLLSLETAAPNEDHVRQLVRRLRRVLFKAGIQNVIESGYGSGYRLRLRTM